MSPNPAPEVPPLPPRDELRRELGMAGPTLAFAGRLMAAKALDVALRAVHRVPGVSLVVVGDGPDRGQLERLTTELGLGGRVRFAGSRSRDDVLRILFAADAAVLSSRWENFPHLVVEALAVGTPVIATAVGGVPEVVHDGENGLLVPAGDPDALAAAIERLVGDDELRAALGVCGGSVGRGARGRTAARPDRAGAGESGDSPVRRRLLMVGRTRYTLPLSEPLARKFDALDRELDVRVVATAGDGNRGADPRFRLFRPLPLGRLEGAAFYALLPFRVARELRAFRPDVLLVQGGQETALVLMGRALARSRAKIVLDVHGDWRAPTRLYGSPWRRALAPVGDLLARVALRKADAVRTISAYTSDLVRSEGVEPAAVFPAFMDLDPFLESEPLPLPDRPVALFVGVLERYKAVDVLAAAWRQAAPRVPDADLRIVGRGALGTVVEQLAAQSAGHVTWTPSLPGDGVARALDAATVLVLPSRSEGLGRVIVEAFCRGRGVVGSRVGGIPDLVTDGRTGILVAADDAGALAEALVGVLSDRPLAERLGAEARRAVEPWLATPEQYATVMRELVDQVTSR